MQHPWPERVTPQIRVLVTGDRRYHRLEPIDGLIRELRRLREDGADALVIHGAASGADTICHNICKQWGVPMHVFPADWQKLGRAAGPIRNSVMLKDLLDGPAAAYRTVIAFHDDLPNSKGTRDMCKRGLSAGLDVVVWEFRDGAHRPRILPKETV